MKLDTATALLEAHGWKESVFQLAYPALPDDLRFFQGPDGNHLKLRSRLNNRRELCITAIAINTYEPKPWNSKLDPQRDQFFKSFRHIDKYELNQAPENSSPPL